MRRFLATLLGTALVVGMVSVAANASSNDPRSRTILDFRTMVPVTGPFVGSPNPIRGIIGGGLPWQIEEAKGELEADGHLKVEVEGLVLLDGNPVPPDRQGTNPIPNFVAVVSCETIEAGAPATVNVATDPFPASPGGDSRIEATVSLPSPCIAPIVFVGPAPTTWFAATGV